MKFFRRAKREIPQGQRVVNPDVTLGAVLLQQPRDMIGWHRPAWPSEEIGVGVTRCPAGEGQIPHAGELFVYLDSGA